MIGNVGGRLAGPRRSWCATVAALLVGTAGSWSGPSSTARPGDDRRRRRPCRRRPPPVTRGNGDPAGQDPRHVRLRRGVHGRAPGRAGHRDRAARRRAPMVERGGVLYAVDNQAVRLLYGELPAYRDFGAGMTRRPGRAAAGAEPGRPRTGPGPADHCGRPLHRRDGGGDPPLAGGLGAAGRRSGPGRCRSGRWCSCPVALRVGEATAGGRHRRSARTSRCWPRSSTARVVTAAGQRRPAGRRSRSATR